MTFSPIMERELRRAARDSRTYWIRLWVGMVATFSVLGMLLPVYQGRFPLGQTGWVLFTGLAGLGMGYALCAGMFVTADALSQERRTGTLDLLLLTPLRRYEIVLGKLIATSLQSFFGLLPAFPILGLTMFWGGVTGGEFGRILAVITNTLFLSLAVGMLVSAGHRDGRKALLATAGLISLLSLAPLARCLWTGLPSATTEATDIMGLSPLLAFYLGFDLNYEVVPGLFWNSLLWAHLLGWIALAGASLVLGLGPVKAVVYPAASRRTWARVAHRTVDPLNPLLGSAKSMSRLTQIGWVLGVGYGLWILLRVFRGQLPGRAEEVTACLFLWQTWLVMWIGWEATRRLHEARQSGELELLLVTPLSVQQIVHGKLAVLGRRFFWPVVTVIVLGQCFFILHLGGPGAVFDRPVPWFVLLCLTGLLVFESIAVAWVAIWQGAAAQRATGAFVRTLLIVLLLPWLEFLFVGPFLVFLLASKPDLFLVLTVWFACQYFNACFWTGWAANRCYDGFQDRVATWAAR